MKIRAEVVKMPPGWGWIAILLLATGVPAAGVAPAWVEVETLPTTEIESLEQLVHGQALLEIENRIEAPDRYVAESFRLDNADPIRSKQLQIEAVSVDGPNRSGIVRFAFRILVGGVPRGVARATLRGRVYGPVLVAKNPLLRGEPIPVADVEIVDTDITRLDSPPVRELTSLVNRAPRRTLGRGTAIAEDLLQPLAVVRQGETVEVRIERRGLLVSASARVLRDAAPGEIVEARNLRTGTRIFGRVQPDGSILVAGNEEPRRQ